MQTPVGTLSGGNQQKVILARELGREHKVLVASQPTRGLDVGSIEFVHRRIVQQRDHGVAVLIVSAELDEIYALADRIAVMYEGKITGFRPPTVPAEELGLLMAGGSERPPARAPAAGTGATAPRGEHQEPANERTRRRARAPGCPRAGGPWSPRKPWPEPEPALAEVAASSPRTRRSRRPGSMAAAAGPGSV